MNPEEEGLIPPKPSVKAPANFTSPDELYKELEDSVRKYHPSDDLSLIRKAYEVALNSHGDQRRRSGEPYIIHPLCVAIILAELELDKESIAAGLLHDVLEDTPMTLKELIGLFGEEIAFLVDGVTKLTQINWDMDKIEIQAENLRKMFLACKVVDTFDTTLDVAPKSFYRVCMKSVHRVDMLLIIDGFMNVYLS